MKKWILVSVLFASFLWLPQARAVYVFDENSTDATYVYRYTAFLCPGTTHTFSTANTASGGDPVMHLVRGTTEVGYSDDSWVFNGEFWVLSNEARITYTVPFGFFCLPYQVIVRAYDNDSGGTTRQFFDFYWNGGQIAHLRRLAGFQINPAAIIGSQETLETVLVNDGAPATMLYAFDWNGNHHAFRGLDQSSGVGPGSKLPGSDVAAIADQLWVVATPNTSTREGPVRLVRNDAAIADTDGDGLGDTLELLGTYTCWDTTGTTGYGFDCSTATTPMDTDGDGLRDAWEVLGEDDATLPSLFPKWGASPNHKDIFVELDRLSFVPFRFAESDANISAARYAAIDIDNPDGVTGINMHFDIGSICESEPGDVDGNSAICGQWGGANDFVTGGAYCTSEDDCDGICGWFNAGEGYCIADCRQDHGGHLTPNRVGRFHWVLETEGNGAAGLHTDTACIRGGMGWGDLTHELGHNLNLRHHGADSAGKVNYKTQYPSMMSYQYQFVASYNLSDGSRSTPLDPRNVNEIATFGSGTDISNMLASPFYYQTEVGTGNIDWNRDGIFSPSVQAHVCCPTNTVKGLGEDAPLNLANEHLPSVFPLVLTDVGPGAATFQRYSTPATFALINGHGDNNFYYSYLTSGSFFWSDWVLVGNPFLYDVHHVKAEPAAVAFDTTQGPRLVIFGVAPNGGPQFTTLDSNGNVRDCAGNSNRWCTTGVPVGVTFESVSVTVLGEYLYAVTRDVATDEVYLMAVNSSLGFYQWRRAEIAGEPIQSDTFTPGVAAARDGKLYVGVKGKNPSSIVERRGHLNVFTFLPAGGADPTVGTWEELAGSMWPDNPPGGCVMSGRPAMMFRDHRDGSGQPFSHGALWVWYNRTLKPDPLPTDSCNTGPYYRWTWGKFGDTGFDFNMGRWYWASIGGSACWDGAADGSGPALASPDHALTAFATTSGAKCFPGDIYHVPYADGTGTPARLLADHDDIGVVRDTLCTSLRPGLCGLVFCQGLDHFLCSEPETPVEVVNCEDNPGSTP